MDQATGVFAQELAVPVRDPGSFRDPSGFVFHLEGEVFRSIDAECSSLLGRLETSGLLDRLQESGGLIPTRFVRTDEPVYRTLRHHVPAADEYLKHEKIPFISYPYEWSPAMLADAALCCLDLQLLLVEHGYSLKDASAYNVQFSGGRPVFIDVPSIEDVPRRDVWMALNQFYRMFLYPLLLWRYRKSSPKEYFLSYLDGADLDEIYRRFGFRGIMQRALWMDVWLPYQLQRFTPRSGGRLRERVERNGGDARAVIFNLKRLERKVRALGRIPPGSSRWSSYAATNSYDKQEEARKEAFILGFLEVHRTRRVLDLGCNTGRYSQLAAKHGASVVAIDTDLECVDRLYRISREDGLDILPLVMDIANPSPGIGFNNVERTPFIGRASFDCVFALAVIHHLLVTARLPLESIRDLFADLTTSTLIVEFVEPQDPMFVSLLGARKDIYSHLTLETFLKVFQERFHIITQASVTRHRTLVRFRKHE